MDERYRSPLLANAHTEWERKDTHIAPVLPERTRDQSNCEITGGASSTGALGATCVPFQGGTASKLGRSIYEAVLAWAKRTSRVTRLRSIGGGLGKKEIAQGWAGEKVRSWRPIASIRVKL